MFFKFRHKRQAFAVSRISMRQKLAAILFSSMLSVVFNAQQVKNVVINNKRYVGTLSELGFVLCTLKGDTVLHLNELYSAFKFQDFNKDGLKDIFLEWVGNIPERYSLYLFDRPSSKFKELKNFESFPDAKLIKGTKLYYSYSRGGCADNTWNSRLFYIKEKTAVEIGMIHGEGCGIKDGIYIYRGLCCMNIAKK